MISKDDLYVILEINRAASVTEIKRAFRKLARRYHPDINPGDGLAEERFKMITEAYENPRATVKTEVYCVDGCGSGGGPGTQRKDANRGFRLQGFNFRG